MLNKLRRRFILDTMIIAVSVIIISVLLLILATYTFSKNSAEDSMSAALQNVTAATVHMETGEDGTKTLTVEDDALYLGENSAVLIFSKKGELLYEKASSKGVAENINNNISQITEAVMESDKSSGILSAQAFRYCIEPLEGFGTKVALKDRSVELEQLYFQIRMYVVLTFLIIIAIMVLCDFLARKSILPVDQAIQTQQQFIADASHELKTPLTVILANLDIIEATPEATVAESEKWLENTKSEAKRMWKLVNEMLFLARSDAAMDMNYNYRLLNFSEVVDEVVLTSEAFAFERNITFIEDVAENSQVVGDRERLKQLVMILVDNAFKYVDENGTVTITLTTSPFRSEVLTVTNTGTPIPPEKSAHIFDRFYRAEESRVRDKGGYGLGLSIAMKLVERHNGEIGLDYSDERGTSFSVRLPHAQSLKAPELSENADIVVGEDVSLS